MSERWKNIEGYDGLYKVSSFGRVRSLHRRCRARSGGFRNLPERILKPQPNKGGYLKVRLSNDGTFRQWLVHCLVANAFLGPRPDGLDIHHKDDNKHNNGVLNLEYLTKSDHCILDGRERNFQ